MKKQAFNPFLPADVYIPDGEPHIFGDRVYLYGSHDFEGGWTFCMGDYTVYSAPVDDLSDWRCEGVIYRAEQDPDYQNRKYMYAPDAVQGNDGRYYLYYCMSGEFGYGGYYGPICVAVCDEPAGKYEYLGYVRYPDGTPMKKYACFDPCAFNDDGRIFIYYGTQYQGEENDVLAADDAKMADVMKRYDKSRDEILATADNVNGPAVVELEDDMLTVKGEPRHIIPYGVDFGGHEFFEASSMRRVNEKYYFVYSSQKNHELCYAVSDYPDRDFEFRGTIVSNGDVGINGITDENRMNMTGTTHGSIIEINGQWYVFYHRLTHKSDYSRQACAERITIAPDGTIKQVEMTSCGLNGGALIGRGAYPAIIASSITNGNMPHGSNKIFEDSFPNVTHRNTENGTERFIGEIGDGTLIAYKYFSFSGLSRITLTVKGGAGSFVVSTSLDGEPVCTIEVPACDEWNGLSAEVRIRDGIYPVYLRYTGSGQAELKEIAFD
ncbi:family 43 glycosylhydrolase [uncultured Ruminococcus sp.]|uniref:family 43 glycosylhydrolase n=1 Tax=uncultured Ruminococcus sp. TaxID=165186 RepID=UPI00262231A9|nr:family 43 glycosylhydrolase [uncultured Ruminococcus sp.]